MWTLFLQVNATELMKYIGEYGNMYSSLLFLAAIVSLGACAPTASSSPSPVPSNRASSLLPLALISASRFAHPSLPYSLLPTPLTLHSRRSNQVPRLRHARLHRRTRRPRPRHLPTAAHLPARLPARLQVQRDVPCGELCGRVSAMQLLWGVHES